MKKKSTILLILLSAGFALSVYASDKIFDVELRGTDIKSALRLLAKMADQNIVVPDRLEGKITASFDAVPLIDAIESILKTQGYGYVEENGILQVVSKEDMQTLGEDLGTASFSLQYAKAGKILQNVQSLNSTRGSAIADERTNSIYIRDTRAAVENIKNMINNVDKKDKQVLIEAKIIEATTDFIRSLGIQWGITKSGGSIRTSGVEAVGTADSGRSLMLNVPAVGYNSGNPLAGVGLILGSFKGIMTDIQLSAAEQKGDVSILSRPSVTTMNNHPAKIRSGTKFYIKTTGDVTIGGGGVGTTANSGNSNLQEIQTGIELNVTPQISESEFIKLDILATESEADFTRAIDGIPAVVDSTASTSVMLKNGETTIIGGLFKVKDAKTVKGIPGLMKVPLVGNLFKSKSKAKAKSELLIFITPRVVESGLAELPHFEEPESAYTTSKPAEEPKATVRKRKHHQ